MSRSPKVLPTLCLALGCLAPLNAEAQPTNGNAQSPTKFPYATLQLGVGFPNNLTGQLEEDNTDIRTKLNAAAGFYGDIGVGYKFGDFRSDVTVGYNNYGNVRQTLSAAGFGSASRDASGNLQLLTVMLNGYYDIPIKKADGLRSRWSPYLGAGIGYGNLSIPDCSFSSECYRGGSMGGFAYQGKAGLSYRATEQGFAFMEGSYLGMTGSTIHSVDFNDFGGWRVSVGWRQGFGGAPKAEVVVAPTPEPIQQPQPTTTPTPEPAAPQPIRGLW